MRPRQPSMTWVVAGVTATALGVVGLQGWPAAAPRMAQRAPATLPHDATAAMRTSLAGTTPDGAATATAAADLVLDPALIRLFDYYLTTVGERPIAAIQAQVDHDLDGRLAARGARQAKDLFARYVRFKTALEAQRPERPAGRSIDGLREGLRAMLALRATCFTAAESQALFGPQDAQASAALERMAIEQDRALDARQRRARLAALDARLPANVRAEREAPLAIVRLEEAAQQIRAQGGSEDEVYRMRAAATSAEAANRLADLDRDEAAWQSRIAAYQAQRDTALSAPGSAADRAAATGALRERLFTPEEQRRLAAYGG